VGGGGGGGGQGGGQQGQQGSGVWRVKQLCRVKQLWYAVLREEQPETAAWVMDGAQQGCTARLFGQSHVGMGLGFVNGRHGTVLHPAASLPTYVVHDVSKQPPLLGVTVKVGPSCVCKDDASSHACDVPHKPLQGQQQQQQRACVFSALSGGDWCDGMSC
jgi:hypothetical protein